MNARSVCPLFAILLLTLMMAGCNASDSPEEDASSPQALMDQYTSFRLTTDLDALSENERAMIPLLIEAAQAMDNIFWEQAYGNRDSLLHAVEDSTLRRFAKINYGPWDRLNDNRPFIEDAGSKPSGANFYPAGMTKDEFEAAAAKDPALESLYTMVRRNQAGALTAIPYHLYFAEEMEQAANRLREAAELADDPGLRRYLEQRAEALLTNEYQASDRAWMNMKDNTLDVIIGPVETYEDQLFGYKAAAETFVLVKDQAWSERLARYAELLPMLQRGLPVPEAYKQESPGRDADLGAYDVIYVSGDANAGPKTIAINLPNDEEVQLEQGTRRLQLKNAMRAKFDEILAPITDVLMAKEQREHVTFEAFFSNTMFHEVAHGLGIKNTVDGTDRTVRTALRDAYTTMEEGKADVLGLYMVTALQEEGELDVDLTDNYVTFMASIFRSIRFGSASAHGRANLIRFNYFQEQDAFTRDDAGTYRVDAEQMQQTMNDLSDTILRLQGDGDYDAAQQFIETYGQMDEQLQADLDRLNDAGIPVDIIFEQGRSVLEGTPLQAEAGR